MTKLTEWLTTLLVLFSMWWILVTKKIESNFTRENEHLILLSPVFAVVAFGLYAIVVVLYRVFTFNDCDGAAKELRTEIKQATADLRRLGYIFREKDG